VITAVLKQPGTIVMCDSERPVPGEGELLVRIKAALTCGTDLKAYLRGHALIPMPGPFGHEFSGVVAGKGKGVRRFRIGDPVMGVHSAPCLRCHYCKRKLYNLCDDLMSTKVLGTFSEYILIPRNIVQQNIFRKPDSISFEEAAFLEPLSCVVHGMEPLNIGKRDTVLIIGAGPIGLLHLLLAKSKGARVFVTALEDERLRTAGEIGADSRFHPSMAAEIVHDLTGGIGVDYVFECTGQPGVWESSVDYLRRGGTVVLFGGCRKGTKVTYDAERLHYDEITLRGTFHFAPNDVRKAYHLLKSRKIAVRKLISGTCSLRDVPDVFNRLARGEGVKYVIRP
jgi:L-iditol 2-dehydrogenase